MAKPTINKVVGFFTPERTKMSRLTYQNPLGEWGLTSVDKRKVPSELYGALNKLKDYEETGLTPNEVVEQKRILESICGMKE